MKKYTFTYQNNEKEIVKYGLCDKDFNKITDAVYEDVKATSFGLTPVKFNGLWGFVDENGKEVIECKYYDVKNFEENGTCIVKLKSNNSSHVLINRQGEIVIDTSPVKSIIEDHVGYFRIEPFNGKDTTIAQIARMKVLVNDKGEIISEQYSELYYLDDYEMYLGVKDTKLMAIDKYEKPLFIPKKSYTEMYYPDDEYGRIAVSKDLKSGFVDFEGNEVIPLIYDLAYEFNDGLSMVVCNDKHGFIDIDGNVIIDLKYKEAAPFNHGLAPVKEDGNYYYINKSDEKQFNQEYKYAGRFSSSGYAKVTTLDGDMAIINTKGEIQFKYSDQIEIDDFTFKDITTYRFEDHVGLIDKDGNKSPHPYIDRIYLNRDSDINLYVGKSGKYGYIRDNGDIVMPDIFDDATEVDADNHAFIKSYVPELEERVCAYMNIETLDYKTLNDEFNFNTFDKDTRYSVVRNYRGLYEIMDENFERVSGKLYSFLSSFHDGYAIASPYPGYNLIDKNGVEIDTNEDVEIDYYSGKIFFENKK